MVLATLVAALNPAHAQQDRRVRVDVQHYVIDAEINPEAQTIAATVQVQFRARRMPRRRFRSI